MRVRKKLSNLSAKLISSILMISLLLVGCSGTEEDEYTIEDIYTSASNSVLLETYSSISSTLEYYNGMTQYIYADAEIITFKVDQEGFPFHILYDITDEVCMLELEGSYYCLAGCYTLEEYGIYLESSILTPDTLEEEVISVEEDGDYKIVTTQASEDVAKEMVEYVGVEYTEDGIYTITYTIELESNSIVCMEATYTDSTGESIVIESSEITYNTERTEATELLYAEMNSVEAYRTITLIIDPNTEDEVTYTASVPVNYVAIADLPYGCEAFYSDEDCTEIFESNGNYEDDVIFYSVTVYE
ncbi:MAG: hypothetical protein R3Y24_04570 [Eubacteriales bacterium]